MVNFNNEEYQILVSDLIGDIYYTSTSYRSKISRLRQYAEVVVRKLFDIPPDQKISLGNTTIRKCISELQHHEYVNNAVEIIKTNGNNCTHTACRDEVTSKDFEDTANALINLLSYFFIDYFEKYDFGSNGSVMHVFSILPPIIRYTILQFLYEEYPDNIFIIDKLVLATLKAHNVEKAITWIEENKESLLQMNVYSEDFYAQIAQQDSNVAEVSKAIAPPNMYQLCKDKIYHVGREIHSYGLLYSDFESAIPFYRQAGRLQGTTPEILEFNDIMDFLYMGQKSRERLYSELNTSEAVIDKIE